MKNPVILSPAELLIASNIGCMHRIRALKLGRRKRFGQLDSMAWQITVDGAQGEMAVAKYFNLYWTGCVGADTDTIDVGDCIEVRTCTRSTDRLILHPDPDDAPEFPYVLVWPEQSAFHLLGWCYGHEGKLQEFWSDPCGDRPAFFVPQARLHKIETLNVDEVRAAIDTWGKAAQ